MAFLSWAEKAKAKGNREGQYAQEFNARPRINMHGDFKDVAEWCGKEASERGE